MRTILVDDEAKSLNMLKIILSGIDGVEIVGAFTNPHEAEAFLELGKIELAFFDVEMPEVSGMELAYRCLSLPEVPAVVFVTGYEQYAMDAWGVEAVDYILKPYTSSHVKKAVEKAKLLRSKAPEGGVEARCFGRFDLRVNQQPVLFKCKKGKELLALLVDARGRWMSSEEIITALWPEQPYDETVKNTYYVTGFRLRRELEANGVQGILEAKKGKYRVDPTQFECDYYRHLEGKEADFTGEYLSEYSWAEDTLGALVCEKK